jgi:digeranylgeranylglycerophospholipid reductase
LSLRKIQIIGGSVAGLGAAFEILKHDASLDVTVYEKNTTVKNYTCAGGVSRFLLQRLNLEIPKCTVASQIRTLRIFSPNACWETKCKNSCYGYVLHRDLFHDYLAKEIIRLGGKIRLGYNVEKLDETADVIVAADGLNGISRKLLRLKQPSLEDIHVGIQVRAKLGNHPRDCISLYFGSLAPKGYTWIFPDGVPDRFRVGLGVPLSTHRNPAVLLRHFLEYIGAEPLGQFKVKLLPTAKPESRLVYNNVLLVGDAGLFCDPATGGGIVQALLSGRNAARAICRDQLNRYPTYCASILRTNYFRYKLKNVLCELSDEDFDTLILTLQDFHPELTSVGKAIFQALTEIAVKNPRFVLRHKVLRKLLL